MVSSVLKVFEFFNREEQRQLYWLIVIVVIRSLFEVVGVASIMPFIAVASNPEIIHSNSYLAVIYEFFGFNSSKSFLLVLGLAVFCVLILNNALAAYTDWKLIRFTQLRGHSLEYRLFARYLSQPYSYFLNRNTADFGVNVLSEVGNFMSGVLRPLMTLVSKLIVSSFILILLLAIDPFLALIVASVLGSAFGAVFALVRKRLRRVGKERAYHNKKRYLCLNESFTGVKEIKVKGCEGTYSDRFLNHSYWANMHTASHQTVSQLPKYALEIVGFGGILLITIYFILTQKDTSNTIPLLALYAFAGYRLMPALQGVFIGATSLRFNFFLVDKLLQDLDMENYPFHEIEEWKKEPGKLILSKGIELTDISFAYPGSDRKVVLESINLKIQSKKTVGFVGKTGSGKTTLVDLLLGLLEPFEGSVIVDGIKIDQTNKRSWMRSIGYVPQQIFLSDTSIRENIALGIKPEDIDDNAVKKAAEIANLDSFICEELPDGYDTIVGERGVRLSGGQCQRIGIARALYHDPQLIVFDEATSALDNVTEKSVIAAISRVRNTKTIVMIAHRLTTLKECDKIFVLSNGRIVSSGTYEELEQHCTFFQDFSENRH
jgi:ABC-type bacteriocin/lantibiotic exporter with double-glycine peptidase domain